MPLFAYVCKQCNAHSEILVRGDEKPVCPECGSKRLEKQMSRFAAVVGSSGSDPRSCSLGGSCPTGSCPTGACPYN